MAEIEKNGNGTEKNRKKKIIAIVTAAVALCLVVAVVLFLLLRPGDDDGTVVTSSGVSEPGAAEPEVPETPVPEAPNDPETPDNLDLPEIPDVPEKPEEPEVPPENADAADEATLRELLLYDGKITINLTGDVTVGAPFIVNGTKMLTGGKTLSYLSAGMANEYILDVSEGSTLIFDGPTLNGSYRGNGIRIGEGGTLSFLSGTIKETAYCHVNGDKSVITVKGGTFTEGQRGIIVSGDSKVYIESGTFTDFDDANVTVGTGGYCSITGDPVFNAGDLGMYNNAILNFAEGTNAEVHGGTFNGGSPRGNQRIGIWSCGKLTVSPPEGVDYFEIANFGFNGIRYSRGADITLSHVYIHDTRMAIEGNDKGIECKLSVSDSKIENVDGGIYIAGSENKVTLTNFTVKGTVNNGVDIHEYGTILTANNCTFEDVKGCAVYVTGNPDAELKANCTYNNLTVKNCNQALCSRKGSILTVNGGTVEGCDVSSSTLEKGELHTSNVLFQNNYSGDGPLKDGVPQGAEGGVLNITHYGIYTDNGSRFIGNKASTNGGALKINDNAVVTLTGTEFTDNISEWSGGAIRVNGSTLNGRNLIFNHNIANGGDGGGAIAAAGGAGTISGSVTLTSDDPAKYKFTNNESYQAGAIVVCLEDSFNITGYEFSNNKCWSYGGGAIQVQKNVFTLNDCVFKENEAGMYGGAIAVRNAGTRLVVNGTDFTGNTAKTLGGAVYGDKGAAISMTGKSGQEKSRISCEAVEGAGAVYLDDAKADITDYILSENSATGASGRGGALWCKNGGKFDVTGCVISDNKADCSGAAYIDTASEMTTENCEITGNYCTATTQGGAVTVIGKYTDTDSIFKGNHTSSNGGAMQIFVDAVVDLTGTTFEKNYTDGSENSSSGGAIRMNSAKVTGRNLKFIGNYTGTIGYGGAISVCGGSATAEPGYLKLTADAGQGKFENNYSSLAGGAIDVTFQDPLEIGIEITGYDFTGNETKNGRGGAVYVANGIFKANNCRFTGNHAAKGVAGAFFIDKNGEVQTESCEITGNYFEADSGQGGAVEIFGGKYSDNGSTFKENHTGTENNKEKATGQNGGAMHIAPDSEVHLDGTSFIGNYTLGEGAGGAAIRINSAVFTGHNLTFSGNHTAEKAWGGAVSVCGGGASTNPGKIELTADPGKGKFENNYAYYGGGAVDVSYDAAKLNITLSISGYTFTANEAKNGSGGAICVVNGSSVTLVNCGFKENTASADGGALSVQTNGGTVTLKKDGDGDTPAFTGNHAVNGGAINFGAGTLTVTGYDFGVSDGGDETDANYAETCGGAVFLRNLDVLPQPLHTVKFTGCLFGGNHSVSSAGAVFCGTYQSFGTDTCTIKGNYITGNAEGGAVCISNNGSYTDTGSTFDGNHTPSNGGAVKANNYTTLNLTGTTFKENRSTGDGAAIRMNAAALTGDNLVFTGNQSGGSGGALSAAGGGNENNPAAKITLTRTDVNKPAEFSDNCGTQGGAIYQDKQLPVEITGYTFTGNYATTNHGGAILLQANKMTLTDCEFVGNHSGRSGGAIAARNAGTQLLIYRTPFKNNYANDTESGKGTGGAIWMTGASVTLTGKSATEKTEISGNRAYFNGGAICAAPGGELNISNYKFSGNTVTDGQRNTAYIQGGQDSVPGTRTGNDGWIDNG